MRDRKRAGSPRLSSVAAISAAALGVVAVVTAISLQWTSARLETAITDVAIDTESQAIANEAERALLMHQRLGNLYVSTREPEVAASQAALTTEFFDLLEHADALTRTAVDRALVADIEVLASTYLAERAQLERQGERVSTIIQRSKPALDATLAALDSLHEINAEQVYQARVGTDRARMLVFITVWGAASVFVLASLAIVLGVRRYLLQPILRLNDTIARLRSGDAAARTSPERLQEIAELGAGLDDMADTLASQREAQLTFLAGVAHDLRNPLSALKLGVQGMNLDASSERQRRLRERLERQVDRLARMIDDLLDATRIEAGQLQLALEACDLRSIAQDVVELYAPTSSAHSIATRLPSDPVLIQGDPLRLGQVVANLLTNAIKYSPQGGPIEIAVEADEGRAQLSVSDRGCGIAEQDLPNIFLPFRRRAGESAPGAGLGLSVVRRIVTAHGGSIDVESTPGEGSTFRVSIPLAEQPANARPHTPPAPTGTGA